jgi:hypothetical protein
MEFGAGADELHWKQLRAAEIRRKQRKTVGNS